MSIFSALCRHPPSWRLSSILWVLRSTTYLSTVSNSYSLGLDSTPALRKPHPATHHGLALTWEVGDAQALTPQFKNQSSDDGFRHDTTVESWVCRPMLSSLFPGRKPGPASDTCDPGTCLFAANLPCPRFARRTFFGRSGCFYRICVCTVVVHTWARWARDLIHLRPNKHKSSHKDFPQKYHSSSSPPGSPVTHCITGSSSRRSKNLKNRRVPSRENFSTP